MKLLTNWFFGVLKISLHSVHNSCISKLLYYVSMIQTSKHTTFLVTTTQSCTVLLMLYETDYLQITLWISNLNWVDWCLKQYKIICIQTTSLLTYWTSYKRVWCVWFRFKINPTILKIVKVCFLKYIWYFT